MIGIVVAALVLLIVGGLIFAHLIHRHAWIYGDNVKRIKCTGENNGWVSIKLLNDKRVTVDLVAEFKKVPGVKYRHLKASGDDYGSSTEEWIVVEDPVGKIVEMYFNVGDCYAGLELNDFIKRALQDVMKEVNG